MASTSRGTREPLTPEEVAGWLGIGDGEELVVQPQRQPEPTRWGRRQIAVGCGIGLLGAVILVGGLIVTRGRADWPAAGVFIGYLGGLWAGVAAGLRTRKPWLAFGEPTVTADALGLTVTWPAGRRRRFAWTEVTAIEPQYGKTGSQGYRAVEHWMVKTERGLAFCLPADAPHAERLADTLLNVVDARNHGRPLWDPTVTAEAGLSRMTGNEAESERGLSQVDA